MHLLLISSKTQHLINHYFLRAGVKKMNFLISTAPLYFCGRSWHTSN